MGSDDARTWTPSGVVTLLTDFGLRDPYVGVMKGVLARLAPAARAIDLTHAVEPQDVRHGAFLLAHSWRWFPEGTVHVAVVDPGVGSARRILVARHGGHAFLAPDNGLLGAVLDAGADVRALDVERFALPGAGRTFHGRDVFVPAAARLAAGLDPAEAGQPAGEHLRLDLPRPRPDGAGVRGEILFADHFGNLVTSVRPQDLPGGPAGWAALAGGERLPVRGTYAEAAPGELLALVDSFDHCELAVRDGSAARRLGLAPGAAVVFVPGDSGSPRRS